MKKIVLRAIGALCIILAAVTMIYLPILTIDGVSSREIKQERRETLSDLDAIQDFVITEVQTYYSYEDALVLADELEDNDLPHTKGTLKKRFSDAEDAIRIVYDTDITINNYLKLCSWLPTFIKDTDNFLSMDDNVIEGILEESENMTASDVEDLYYGVIEIENYLAVPMILVCIFGACMLFVAVTQVIGKWKALKWTLAVVMILVAVLIYVLVPMASSIVEEFSEISVALSEIELKPTVVPAIAALLTVVPVVLDVFIRDKKKVRTEEAVAEAVAAE